MDGVGRLGTMCCRRNSRQEKQDRSESAQDAALRKQIIPGDAPITQATSAATADDPLSNLPNKVRVGALIPFMGIASLDCFSQTSKELCKEADEFAGKQLPSLKKELNELITNSRITGIKNPVGPFKNYMHQLQVLNDFKDALPNAIRVLRGNGITDINATDDDGNTPLHEAARHGHTATAQALINAGANDFGFTPLHEAASHGQTETVRALIKLGADVNLADKDGSTPLHWAAENGETETVRALIELGADENLADNIGFTPIHWAAINGQTETEQALKAAGAKRCRACIIM